MTCEPDVNQSIIIVPDLFLVRVILLIDRDKKPANWSTLIGNKLMSLTCIEVSGLVVDVGLMGGGGGGRGNFHFKLPDDPVGLM